MDMWRAIYTPGDSLTSPAYSSHSAQCLYINHLLSFNKLVLSAHSSGSVGAACSTS